MWGFLSLTRGVWSTTPTPKVENQMEEMTENGMGIGLIGVQGLGVILEPIATT